MGNLNWMTALSSVNVKLHYFQRTTPEVYLRIRDLGLETVVWEQFDISRDNRKEILTLIKQFIEKSNPCLFIYDPIRNGLKKNFLFDVRTFDEVYQWIIENEANLMDYSYLITSQITNPGDGFVGNVLSDGHGRLICETLHRPGVCNQRELSQPKESSEDMSRYLDMFGADEFSIESTERSFVSLNVARDIIRLYGDKTGYFEFVKGAHLGRNGIYTIGFEDSRFFLFPEEIFINCLFGFGNRLRVRAMELNL